MYLNKKDTKGLQDESKPEISGEGKGRVTKFCMIKENGNYADLYYCNVYHNCHGGFDTVQYCANGLVKIILNKVLTKIEINSNIFA